jgi:hypothetical protein
MKTLIIDLKPFAIIHSHCFSFWCCCSFLLAIEWSILLSRLLGTRSQEAAITKRFEGEMLKFSSIGRSFLFFKKNGASARASSVGQFLSIYVEVRD